MMKLNKAFNISKETPYLIGSFLIAPIIIVVTAFLFQRGNTSAKKYVDGYIRNSDIIEVTIPSFTDEDFFEKRIAYKVEIYEDEYQKKKMYMGETAYCEQYQKYVSIIMFGGYDYYDKENRRGDLALERNKTYFHEGNVFLVRANRRQLNDSRYGTKENPVPVFWYKFVSGKREDTVGHKHNPNNPFHVAQDSVTDDINRVFVEQYLTRFLPKKELKRLFEDE